MDGDRFVQQEGKDAKRLKCILCDEYVEGQKSFTCRRCRKSPFCIDHLDREHKLCPGCATEQRIRHHNDLLRQEKSIRAFLRLTQFIFMVTATLFTARRLFYDRLPEILMENVFFKYIFIWGGVSIGGMIFCYIMLSSQKQKVSDVEDKIQDHKVYSRYMRR